MSTSFLEVGSSNKYNRSRPLIKNQTTQNTVYEKSGHIIGQNVYTFCYDIAVINADKTQLRQVGKNREKNQTQIKIGWVKPLGRRKDT